KCNGIDVRAVPERLPNWSRRLYVPEPSGLVPASCHQRPTVRAERHRLDPTLVLKRLPSRQPARNIPELGRLVRASRHDGLAVGAEGGSEDTSAMRQWRADGLTRGGVPGA